MLILTIAAGSSPVLALVTGEEVRCRAAVPGLLLEIDIGERLTVVVADDEAGVGLLD